MYAFQQYSELNSDRAETEMILSLILNSSRVNQDQSLAINLSDLKKEWRVKN